MLCSLNQKKPNGFCLIEVLMSLMIFSVFLAAFNQVHQSLFKQLTEIIQMNAKQLQINHAQETAHADAADISSNDEQ